MNPSLNKVTIKLLNSTAKMIEFYVGEASETARGLEAFYEEVAVFYTDLKGEAAAEEMFDLTNNPYRQEEREETYGRGRSLSVGDKVQVGDEEYVCAPCGWALV
jgi:hypothetical protein